MPTYATVCVIEKSFIIGIAFYHIETNKRTLSDSCLNRLWFIYTVGYNQLEKLQSRQ